MSVEKNSSHSDICICCKRSKRQGTFFAVVQRDDGGSGWIYGSWKADVEVFRAASEQGCRRCRFVFEAIQAHGDGVVPPQYDLVCVRNVRDFDLEFTMSADIGIYIRKDADSDWVTLELMRPLGS
jgi:hypothetical protein